MPISISRRNLLLGASAGALSVGFGPAFAANPPLELLKGEGDVIVCAWGGRYIDVMKEVWFEPFGDEMGISVNTTGTPDLAKLKVMQQVGNVEWDLIDTEGTQMQLAIKDDLLEKIDYDLIYKIVPKEDLVPEMVHEYGLGSVTFSTVIAWNSDKFPEGPKDWAEFFDTEKFKGRRALYAQPKPALEIALMATGVPKDQVYPIDLDKAFAALDQIADKVDLWVEKSAQWAVLMQNREVDLLGSTLVRVFAERRDGQPFNYHFNQSITEQSYWTIPKGAPHAASAQKLLAYMMQGKGMAEFVSQLPYGVANSTIYAGMPAEMVSQLPASPENAPLCLKLDESWWAENAPAVQPRWLEWISKR